MGKRTGNPPGRPIKERLDYYPHDVGAAQNDKIITMRLKFGNDGYAFYFLMLEKIYEQPKAELIFDENCRLRCIDLVKVSKKKFESMLEEAFTLKLFDKKIYEKSGRLTSEGIQKRAKKVYAKRIEMREDYQEKKAQKVSRKTEENSVSGSISESETLPENSKKSGKSIKYQDIRYIDYKDSLSINLSDGQKEGWIEGKFSTIDDMLEHYSKKFALSEEDILSIFDKCISLYQAGEITHFLSYFEVCLKNKGREVNVTQFIMQEGENE